MTSLANQFIGKQHSIANDRLRIAYLIELENGLYITGCRGHFKTVETHVGSFFWQFFRKEVYRVVGSYDKLGTFSYDKDSHIRRIERMGGILKERITERYENIKFKELNSCVIYCRVEFIVYLMYDWC